ncbi:hypothetical protein PGLA_14325 [Paenibacillus glacialis]|uniref:Uncharacterized protein n=2 Tax=Paenibacillus glacialis TaxID=494026 RepID=A0A168KH05_9BACL|nr:hypothetical protein PGLA_14325 [Paenibacillus glacialis]
MVDEINAISPTSTTFVIHYLGKEPSVLKKTSPSRGFEEILNKVYAASIDMILPTQASQLSEVSGYIDTPIFVTFDKGIKLLFDSLLVMGEHQLENGVYIPAYSTKIFYSSGWKDADIYELCRYAQLVQKGKRKKGTNIQYELQRLNGLALKLEQELMMKMK